MVRVPFDPAIDYYHLLGVGPRATNEEIQAAYRRLAKAYHPDLNAGSANAAERMSRLNVAKSVLLDRDTRAIYDQMRGLQPVQPQIVNDANGAHVTMRYPPYGTGPQPRYRVVSRAATRSVPRSGFDRGTGILLLVAVPLIAALSFYVVQAVQLSIQPSQAPPSDAVLAPGTTANRPTARGAADAVFTMLHAQPPSRELAIRANNFILARSDSSPDSELLRADGRRLVRAATDGDNVAWDAAVTDVCHLAARC
jgi:curved DNA-binding protein CbpA